MILQTVYILVTFKEIFSRYSHTIVFPTMFNITILELSLLVKLKERERERKRERERERERDFMEFA